MSGTFSHGTRISSITVRVRYTFLAKTLATDIVCGMRRAGRTRPEHARVSHVRSNTRDKTKTNVHSTQTFSQSPV